MEHITNGKDDAVINNNFQRKSIFDEYVIYEKVIPERKAVYKDIPSQLNSELVDFLSSIGINQLYSHQAEMF